jgi:mono/diheme cytochrome c family protein
MYLEYHRGMKRTSVSQYLIWMVVLTLSCFVAFAADDATKTIKKVNAQPTATLNGVDLFKEYCAVCHGSDGKGAGPAADALKKHPADLTQLSRKNGGAFPELHVMNYIKGADTVASHGSRDMPIWGNIFSQMSQNPDLVQVRVYALLKYIEQFQAK